MSVAILQGKMTISRYSLVPDPAARLFGCTKGRTDQSIGGMRRPSLRQTCSHLRDPSRAGRTAKGRHQARLRSRVQPGSAKPRSGPGAHSRTYLDDNASACPGTNHITVQCHPTISPNRCITGMPGVVKDRPDRLFLLGSPHPVRIIGKVGVEGLEDHDPANKDRVPCLAHGPETDAHAHTAAVKRQ